jgi:hypothetical protein
MPVRYQTALRPEYWKFRLDTQKARYLTAADDGMEW